MAFTKIGAGWKRKSKTNGEPFVSLDINGVNYMMFKNKHKEKDAHPDYVVMVTTDDAPKGDTPTDTSASVIPDYPTDELTPDDIPFN